MFKLLTVFVFITTGLSSLSAFGAVADGPADYATAFPVNPDPFSGNWVGEWVAGKEKEPELAAQIIALGEDAYRVIIKHRLDVRTPPLFVADIVSQNGMLEISTDTVFAIIKNDRFVGGKKDSESRFEMTPAELASPTLHAVPPKDAVVLFDGSDLSAWRETPGWNVTDSGTLFVTPGSADLVSEQRFADMQLHLEFRLPYMPTARGQDRANSGVYVHNAYEVQILDSFGLEGYYEECGALYKVAAPKVNACRPPLQWQTYDITYTAARYSDDGEVVSNPRMTVVHNGVLIHNDQELRWRTGGNDKRFRPHPAQPQNLKLQEHKDYIEFRNIWLVEPKN